MNAYEAAAKIMGYERVNIVLEMNNGRTCYHPETRTVNLLGDVSFSTKIEGILQALHECGHAQQHLHHPVLFGLRNLWLVRLWLERDAWRKAHAYAHILGLGKAVEGLKATAHPSYWRPRIFVHCV